MRFGADLSIDGIALLVAELLERLDLHDVTLIMNDWGGPQLLVDHDRIERISRLVLVACEAFDNFPPGTPGRRLAKLAATPGGFGLQSVLLRSAAVRRSVAAALAKRPVPDELLRDWFAPFIRDQRVRQDLRSYCLSVPLDSGRNWSAGLVSFDKPALVVWAPEDQMMPPEHGRRLADSLPDRRLVEITESYGTTYHFIDASPAEALETAREAADGQDVRIGGGPTTIREFLAAGLIDHMDIVVVPILLGRGIGLWDGLEGLEKDYQIEATSSPSGVTHVTFTRTSL